MAVVSPYLSVIPLNVSGLNSPVKRYRVAEWIKRQNPTRCCLQETPASSTQISWKWGDRQRYSMKMETEKKKAKVSVLTAGEIVFKSNAAMRDKVIIE